MSIVWTDTLPTLISLGVPHSPGGSSAMLLSGEWMLRKRWSQVYRAYYLPHLKDAQP
jgi:hypothetical protein